MRLAIFIFFIGLVSCKNYSSQEINLEKTIRSPSATSLGGVHLFPLEESEAVISRKDSLLEIAKSNYYVDSTNLENIIWYGRRTAYLYRYETAIKIYTDGLISHPEAPELFRHRGHRYISARQFDKAISDFKKAAHFARDRDIEIEPDGIPNKLDIPLSNLQFNIYYHWALAHYLKGDFENAAKLYEVCLGYSVNADLYAATTDWLYMTYRRMRNVEKASALLNSINEGMEMVENESYFKRLLMYKGLVDPIQLLDLDNHVEEAQLDIVTQGYGVGNWYLYNGEAEKARDIFSKILESQYWPAFGYIAAEAEMHGENIER